MSCRCDWCWNYRRQPLHYELSQLGYQVTVVDRHLYPAMETSFANGGQLSACNAEVWNQKSTVLKGMKWMSQKSALYYSIRPLVCINMHG